MSVMYERVVQIVSKPPEKRKDQEVEMMLPWFRKKAAVFSQLSTEVIADIIRNCQFITVQRDHVIIKQGDVGDCFYIILRGKVSIFINNLISDEDDENLLAEQTQELLKNPKTGKGELDRSKFGNCIAPLDEGKSFGELALISKDCVRNASIIADQTTDLVVVNRDLYNRSLRAEQEADLNERNSFVTDNPLFRYWAHRYKKQMAFSIKKEVVPFDGIIAKQGDPVDCIYFIQKGQAKIVVEPSLHETQYPNLHPMEQEQAKPEEEEDFVIPLRKETTALGEATTTPSAGRRKESRRKAMELSIVGKNEIIGDVEFVLDLKTYIQSVIATQPCQLFSLDLKNYERLVVRKNAKTVQMIREQAEMKISCRLKRLPERAVPLLRVLSNKLQSFNKPSSSKAKQHKPVIYSSRFSDIVPQRGAIVDLFGPGTIFYRNRMREKARSKAANKGAQFRGANVGFRLRLAQNVAHGDNGGAYYDDPGSGLFASQDPFMSATAGGGAMGAHEHQHEDDQEHTPEIEPLEKNTFKDYQSCDRVLTNLEDRIKAWHSIMREGNNKRAKPQAVKLHRLSLDENMQLKPGKKVIFQRRQIRGPKLPNQPLDNEDERDDEPITGQETTSKSRIEPPAYIIKQQGSRYPGDHEEQAMSTVHGARVPGTQEAAAMAPASSHNIFITSPASHMHQQQQQQHPHQQQHQQHPHQQQHQQHPHQQQHLYDDDTVFNRQKAMPETHALSIVCGSVDHNHKSPYNHGYNSNRLQPIIPPSTDNATDTGTASGRKSADSGRCSPSSWSSSSSGGQNTKKKSKSKKKTLSAPKESAKNLSRSWPR